jgi:hypothetical protein
LALQRTAGVRGGLVTAEGLVQPRLVLPLQPWGPIARITLHGAELPTARASRLGGTHRGDKQQPDDEAEGRRHRQQPALRVADGRPAKDRDLAGDGVLPDQITHQGTADNCQNEEERGHVTSSGVV